MDSLPNYIEDIILDYKYGLEHYEKYKRALNEIPMFFWCQKRCILNWQFRCLFFPDFYSDLFFQQQVHPSIMSLP